MTLYPSTNPHALAMEAILLAYGPSAPMGLGVLHYKAGGMPDDTRKWVEEGLREHGGRVYLDYVDGRMMKLSFTVKEDGIEHPDGLQNPSYQSWAVTYPTYVDLLQAAEKNLVEAVK